MTNRRYAQIQFQCIFLVKLRAWPEGTQSQKNPKCVTSGTSVSIAYLCASN